MDRYDLVFLRLLELGPFDRRSRGGWRFGTKTISDQIVARLIASGHARRDGDRIVKAEPALAPRILLQQEVDACPPGA